MRVGSRNGEDIKILSARKVEKLDLNYPHNAMHIWAENAPVDDQNKQMLDLLNKPLVTLIADDQYPAKAPEHDINKALERGRCANGGLNYRIDLKEGARVMLTTNIDVEDRLINGQIGTVVKIKLNAISSKPEVIYVKFDDKNAGEVRIRTSCDRFAMNNCAVPITAVLAGIKPNENRPSSPEIRRTQFPLTLAWACTVHKVQGLTLEKVVFLFRSVQTTAIPLWAGLCCNEQSKIITSTIPSW